MQLDPDETVPPAEQLGAAALELAIAVRLLGPTGLGNDDLLPPMAAATARAVAAQLNAVSERVGSIAALLARKVPRPVVAKTVPPARANKRPAGARTADKPPKVNGSGKTAPAAAPAASPAEP